MNLSRVATLGALAASVTSAASASDLVDVLPLTDRIVMLHFDDGYVLHHKRGEPRSQEQVIVSPLDTERASRPQSYQLTSDDDPAFARAQSPSDVGRKSKGTDFAWFADSWVNGRAVNTRPDHAKEHWVYLFLSSPMQPGKTYRIATGDLAANGKEWKLPFNPQAIRSEAVHVNIIGYAPQAPQKFGYVYHWMGDRGTLDLKPYDQKPFYLIDQTTQHIAFTGKLALRKKADNPETFHVKDSPPVGNFLNADVYECDFSSFNTPGKYIVAVENMGTSFPFKIDADVYREPFYAVARGLYHNRSGIELKEPYTPFTRPAPHNPNITPGFKDKLIYTKVRWSEWGSEGGDAKALLAASPGPLNSAWGWYQDAGDWDSYYTHLRPAQELMLVYEMAPANFKDNELNIPESGNGVPDILDEAAWLPRFCYRQRHELMEKKYGTGGIGLRVAGDAFGTDEKKLPDGKMVGQGSWEDVDRVYAVSGEDPWSTYRYAGAAAQLAYCLQIAGQSDPEGVDWAKEAAESYQWAKENTRPGDEQKANLKEPRSYAAAALFRLTGDKQYEQQFAEDTKDIQANTLVWDDRRYGPMVYCLSGGKATNDPAIAQRIRTALLATADHVLSSADKRALRWGGNWSMPMLVGQQTTPWVLELAVGHALTRDNDAAKAQQYLGAVYTTCDYFLGTNAHNHTWVTGLGVRHVIDVFHMDAWYNGKDQLHPGLIPYSPWRKQKEFGMGPWDQEWANPTAYPAIDEWPGNERWFNNRCSPMASEFTIHQNIGPAAAIYGYLCAPGPEAKRTAR